MALARKCDVCGKFYEPYGLQVGDKNGIKFVRTNSDLTISNLDKLDCCKECLAAIEDAIENRKD